MISSGYERRSFKDQIFEKASIFYKNCALTNGVKMPKPEVKWLSICVAHKSQLTSNYYLKKIYQSIVTQRKWIKSFFIYLSYAWQWYKNRARLEDRPLSKFRTAAFRPPNSNSMIFMSCFCRNFCRDFNLNIVTPGKIKHSKLLDKSSRYFKKL